VDGEFTLLRLKRIYVCVCVWRVCVCVCVWRVYQEMKLYDSYRYIYNFIF